MSGRKTTYTTISDQELRRLRERAAQATTLQESNRALNQLSAKNDAALVEYRRRINDMNSSIAQLNRQLAAQGSAATKEAQALRQQLQRTVRESNERIQAAAQKNEERVRAMQQTFSSQLAQTRGDAASAVSANNHRIQAAMEQTSQHLEQEMREMQAHIASDMAGVQSRLDTVEESAWVAAQNQRTLLDMAREYGRTARVLLADIREHYRAELLCPGRLEQVQAACATAESEIALTEKIPENSSAARGANRQALEAALLLHQDVICAEQEWTMHFQAARQMLNTAQAQLEASRTLALPEEGDASVDVDRWTGGDLAALGDRLGALEAQLDGAEGAALAQEELDGIQSAGLQISREIDDTSEFALEAFFASQDRGEIAQDIANQLNAHGLTVVDHSYQGADQRSAHRLHLINRVTGFEIVITQTPEVQNGAIVNRLESDILNYGSLNEEHGDTIARGVLGSLSGLGFKQTEVATVAGFERMESDRREFANMRQWRDERAPEIVKPSYAAGRSAGN